MEIDYQHVFEQMPTPLLVLDSALRVVAVNDAYLAATMTTRSELLGRNMFESFPGNPADASASGPGNLRASLEKVLRTGERDTMAVQRYDIPDGEGFVERYWSPVNAPVIGGDGSVVLLLHRVEDITGYVRERQSGSDQERINALLSRRADSLEADLSERAGALQDVNRRLQDARRELGGVATRQAALARLGQLAPGGTSIADLAKEVPLPCWAWTMSTSARCCRCYPAVARCAYAPEPAGRTTAWSQPRCPWRSTRSRKARCSQATPWWSPTSAPMRVLAGRRPRRPTVRAALLR